ncbi:MAG: glutathione S-transferase family protein [Cyanobacteriota bacterium]
MTLTLYGSQRSRASMPRWYMAEKDLDHIWIELDLQAGEHRRLPYSAINPFGKVPALVDSSVQEADGGPLKIYESGAILLHLADLHAQEFASPADRAKAIQWVLFANSTLSNALFVPSSREREFSRLMTVLEQLLAPGEPLIGSSWGVADCVVQAHLAYLPVFFPDLDLSPYPQVRATIAATQQRPAYRQVMQLDGPV